MILLDEYCPDKATRDLLRRVPCMATWNEYFRSIVKPTTLLQISNVPLSAIVSMTMRKYHEELRDNVCAANPLLARLSTVKKGKTLHFQYRGDS